MRTLLTITIPFFALILAGYVAASRRWVPPESVPAFNGFLLWFAVPAMLFRFSAGTPFREIANGPLFAAWVVSGLAVLALTTWIARRLGQRLRDAAFLGMAGSVGNLGFMGVPMLVALLGPKAAAPVIVCIVADLTFVASAGLAVAHLDPVSEEERRHGVRDIVVRVASNPLLIAMLLGAAFSYCGWTLPIPVAETVRLLGDAAGPCALFAIGASLVRTDAPLRSPIIALPVAAKLLLHPLVALGVMLAAGVETFTLHVAILCAALPSAGWVFIFAQKHEAGAGRIAAAILVATALAFVTISVLLAVLGVAHH